MAGNPDQLAGKVVVISGGAGGLGSAFARHLVERGGSVVLSVLTDAGAFSLNLGQPRVFLT